MLDALPPGSGDLVVRGRIVTDLACATPDVKVDSLAFEVPGAPHLGGIAIGEVTGIDAAGERAAGWMRCDGDTLDLVLPASFVDGARLPLVLDPLISTAGTVQVGGDPKRPDAASERLRPRARLPHACADEEVEVQFDRSGLTLGIRPLATSLHQLM